jgi:L-threonylcarbamoyladenylate synthase
MLREVLPRVELSGSDPARDAPMPSPGMLEKHYSPRAPLTLYEGRPEAVLPVLLAAARAARAAGKVVGIIAAEEDYGALTSVGERDPQILLRTIGAEAASATVASRLYGSLRELDAAGADVILVRGFPAERGLGVAVQDRLRRAAAGRVVTV